MVGYPFYKSCLKSLYSPLFNGHDSGPLLLLFIALGKLLEHLAKVCDHVYTYIRVYITFGKCAVILSLGNGMCNVTVKGNVTWYKRGENVCGLDCVCA